MQQTTPDPSQPPGPSGSDDLVRAARDGGVDAAFRPALDAGEALHRHMVRARVVSARMVALQRSERVGFHHASLGEEAAIAGAVLAMRATDWVFPGAREWYATLARGLPLDAYVHHAFGSASDPAKGHAAPDHAPARALHVVPPSGVVGAHLPQAVGAAWAAKIRRDDVAALALFGAEVAAGGDFHNALNFAGVFKVPVVFACRAPADARVVDRAVAYGLAGARVDGGDALAVFTVVKAALERAIAGEGATLVELVSPVLERLADGALTDAALVSSEVLDLGAADPLTRLRAALGREKRVEPGAHEVIAEEARAELDAAVSAAERAGAPSPATIFDHVYAGVPAHLAAERERLAGAQRNGG
ncbi:MAG: thiamine pyrophosphate-dependent dehydrogenase E1 component subunit alpha [Labilithrix sp.]|nr:thiamine pyrophosphate-dependent dehydrogenase E1 component subunit alpha [Labilithrix sp.]